MNGDEIGALNGKIVLIDREFEKAVNGGIHNGQPMTFSGSKSEFRKASAAVQHILPVDETVVSCLWAVRAFLIPDVVDGAVVVICQKHLAEVNVPIFDRGTVDHERAEGALAVLESKVAVVPCWAVTRALDFVGERAAGWDGTLSDAGDAVVAAVVGLNEAVPMDRCSTR